MKRSVIPPFRLVNSLPPLAFQSSQFGVGAEQEKLLRFFEPLEGIADSQ